MYWRVRVEDERTSLAEERKAGDAERSGRRGEEAAGRVRKELDEARADIRILFAYVCEFANWGKSNRESRLTPKSSESKTSRLSRQKAMSSTCLKNESRRKLLPPPNRNKFSRP